MAEDKVKSVKCWCHVCGREQNHALLFSHTEYDKVDHRKGEFPNSTIAEVLKCLGCDALNTRHRYCWDSIPYEDVDVHGELFQTIPEDVHQAPPRQIRPKPMWVRELPSELAVVLDEIYSAASQDCSRLAAIGLRLIVDVVATKHLGDIGSLEHKKLPALLDKKLITELQKDVLVTVIGAGDAAAHRGIQMNRADLIAMLDAVESLLRITYCDPQTHKAIRSRIPRRRKRKAKTP